MEEKEEIAEEVYKIIVDVAENDDAAIMCFSFLQ
jgi:phenylpyruvate tautomerase PptA (4-oxalocrotonate tautomerase family)